MLVRILECKLNYVNLCIMGNGIYCYCTYSSLKLFNSMALYNFISISWSYSEKKNYYGGMFGGSSLAVTKLESNKVCVTPENNQIRSIRKVGNSDAVVPAISFYIEFSLRGRELYFDGTFLRLPWPILFRSLGFTGNNTSWSLYSGTELTGTPSCIGQTDSTLITYSSGTKLSLIGSVQRNGDCSKAGTLGIKGSKPSSSLTLGLRDRSKEISTDSTELRLPYPITVYSFTFSGASNWTIYRGILFNGKPKCLTYTEGDTGPLNFTDDDGGYPISYVIVGSIRRGCNFSTPTGSEEDYPFDEDENDIYEYEDEPENSASVFSVSIILVISGLIAYLYY